MEQHLTMQIFKQREAQWVNVTVGKSSKIRAAAPLVNPDIAPALSYTCLRKSLT